MDAVDAEDTGDTFFRPKSCFNLLTIKIFYVKNRCAKKQVLKKKRPQAARRLRVNGFMCYTMVL